MATSGVFFNDLQIDLLTQVLDRIIPPNERMPGAGEVAVGYLDDTVSRSARLRRSFGNGLFRIQVCSQEAHATDFINLSDTQKDVVLRQVETAEPAFFDAMLRHAYNGYYTNPRVVELLGLEARPPQPKGHQIEQGDFGPMENVKRRGIVFREA